MNKENYNEVLKDAIHSIKLFFWGTFFWVLPSIIPVMEPLYDYTTSIYDWVEWQTNIIAAVLVFRSARKMSKTLKLLDSIED